MPTISEIESTIRSAVARGNTVDTEISDALRRAHKWIEDNYTFQYMQRFVKFTLNEGLASIPLPSNPKHFEWIRTKPSFTNDKRPLTYLVRIDPVEIKSTERGEPQGWWLDGNDFIRFDREADQDYDLEMLYAQHTDFQNLGGSDATWLTENAEELLVAQTMLHLAPILRDPQLQEMWAPQRDRAIQGLLRAQEQMEWEGSNLKMGYRPKGAR